MTEKLSNNELQWLREFAIANSNADRRIPQLSLARLLKCGLVESYDMMTLRITRKGWNCLTTAAPEFANKCAARSIRYALVADSDNIANMQIEKT